jgi:hypothetical protein
MIDLIAHPSTRSDVVDGIRAEVRRSASGTLECTFRIVGDVARIRVPTPRAARIAEGLWQHTCLEAFIAIEGRTEYHEFNFAPSGEWTACAFRGYRDGAPLTDETLAPSIALRATEEGLELRAVVQLERLSRLHPRAPLRVGLSAVIEARDGTRSYWALRHRAEKPDFHDANTFALRLESPVP